MMLRYPNNFKFPLLNFRGIIPSLELVSVDSGNVDKNIYISESGGHEDIGMILLARSSPNLNIC